MDEDELEKIREKKLKEMQEQEEDAETDAENQRQQIKSMAAPYLTKEAKSRLGNIRAAKPEMTSQIETQIARLGQMGQISKGEITDSKLKQMLKELQNDKEQNSSDIKHRYK